MMMSGPDVDVKTVIRAERTPHMNSALDDLNPQALGDELRSAREKRGMTQQDAAGLIGVARTTLIAIEKGERRIRASELMALASAYGREVGDFVRRERPQTAAFEPQFRAAYRGSSADSTLQNAALDEFEAVSRDYVELEKITGDPLAYRYPAEYTILDTRAEQQAETVAIQERQRLGLGDGPIADLRVLLEREVGLRIFYLDLKPSRYAGAYVYDTVLGGCIAVNRQHPPERRRWSLAHEYAHFLAHRQQVDLMQEDAYQRRPVRERFAEMFAKHFLMPISSIGRQLGSKAIQRTDLFILAHYYGVSVQAMTLRLEELRYIPTGTWDDLKSRGIRIREVQERLGLQSPDDSAEMLPLRFQYLAISALESEKISEGLFAKFLRLSRARARELKAELQAVNGLTLMTVSQPEGYEHG
jgi:Zn-dependent peptidase ImmA (M78 family)/DNA-binding XRE family transcriptional regulator